MTGFFYGKSKEMANNAEYTAKWTEELLKFTDTCNILTPEELKLGETTEVWLTGADLIKRGAAEDYSLFLKLRDPKMVTDLCAIGDHLYQQVGDGVVRWNKGKKLSLDEFTELYAKSCRE